MELLIIGLGVLAAGVVYVATRGGGMHTGGSASAAQPPTELQPVLPLAEHTELQTLRQRTADLTARLATQDTRLQTALTQLAQAQQSLEAERARLRAEAEAAARLAYDERNRQWKHHEDRVISLVQQLCQRSAYRRRFWHAQALPEGFDPTLKPDTVVEWLGQWLVIDAKQSDNLGPYLRRQARLTAEKYDHLTQLASLIVFAVPAGSLAELAEPTWAEGRFTFWVVEVTQLPHLLYFLTREEQALQLATADPHERETLLRALAQWQRYHDRVQSTLLDLVDAGQHLRVQQSPHLPARPAYEPLLKSKTSKSGGSFFLANS